MKEYVNRRAGSGIGFSRRGSNHAFKEDQNHEDGSIKCCNRLGCSTRFYSMKGTQNSNLEKDKYPKGSIRSVSSNTFAGSSSKSVAASSSCLKPHHQRHNQKSVQEVAKVENSSRRGKIVLANTSDFDSTKLHGLSENVTVKLENYRSKLSSRTQKQIDWKWEPGNQDTSSSSAVRRSIASRNTSQANTHASQGAGSGTQRQGMKSVSCELIPDVQSSSSFSDSGRNKRVDIVRKRSSDGASSSNKSSKSMSASSNGGYTGSQHRVLSAPRPSLQAPRSARNRPISRTGATIARMPRGPSGKTRTGLSEQEDTSSRSVSVPIETSRRHRTQFSISEAASESSPRSFQYALASTSNSTFGPQGTSSATTYTRPIPYSEDINTGVLHSHLRDRDDYHHHINMEGIAEVLLALERIGRNEELTHEQLLALETNFSFGLAFYDQHRGMRLDIDNMSYEELLALEEKMGTVSTALTEEAIPNCLERSIYTSGSLSPGSSGCGDDDTKCSVCQEEYHGGDEVGKLACGHRYHVLCIHEWLRLKNWCPICKVPVLPFTPPPQS